MALRLVFMGTPDFAVPTLLELVGSGHDVVAVYTRAPKPAGRGMALKPSPVAREAERFALPILTPKTLRDADAAAAMRARGADAAVVVAYGLILPKPILDAFPLGCFNLHASLAAALARRGADPSRHHGRRQGNRRDGDEDGRRPRHWGRSPWRSVCAIGPDVTTGDLHDELARLGAKLMLVALGALERGSLTVTPQAAQGATYATRSIRTRPASIGPSRGTKSTTIAVGCRRFPAPGSSFPGLAASRCCAPPEATARVSRAACLTSVDGRLRQRRGADG